MQMNVRAFLTTDMLCRAVAVGVLFASCGSHAAAQGRVIELATIEAMGGDVQICTPRMPAGNLECRRAQEGDTLYNDQVIRTGEDGIARLLYPESELYPETRMELAFGSEASVALAEPLTDAQSTALGLGSSRDAVGIASRISQGVARVWTALTRFHSGPGAFSVRAGTTVCGPRGTDFYVQWSDTTEVGTLALREGAVGCDISGQLRELSAGEAADLVGDRMGPTRTISEEEYVAALAAVRLDVAESDSEEPNLSGVWTSQHGDIHWDEGWYGDENRTLSRGALTRDGDAWVLKGTWGRRNDPSRNGGFEFRFDSPCSFSGSWWYASSPDSRNGWSGSCRR